MEKNENWLNEMLDAAFDEPDLNARDPDFRIISDTARADSTKIQHRRRLRTALIPLAAAAALVLGVSGLVRIRSQLEIRRRIQNETDLFVEQLIGGSLFDEGLESTDPWILDDIGEDYLFNNS